MWHRFSHWLSDNSSCSQTVSSMLLFISNTVFCVCNNGPCFVAAVTYSSGNAWMGEVGNKWSKNKRENEKHCTKSAYFDRILPVSVDSFLALLVGSGSWISSLAQTPVSTHTRIWLFSHSEVQAGGKKPFFPLWGIQHEHSVHGSSLWSTALVQQDFSTGWAIQFSNPAHPTHIHFLLQDVGQQHNTEGAKQRGLTSAIPAAPVARNVKCFPRKFLLLLEARERQQENFNTFQTVGVSMNKREVEVLIGLLWTVRTAWWLKKCNVLHGKKTSNLTCVKFQQQNDELGRLGI